MIDFTDGSDDIYKLHMQYRPATLLIMGLGLETLLKGCIISKEPLSLGDYYPKKLSTHNLNSLYELAGFNPDTEEREFLNHLTAAI